jgi:hypothetical protein
MCFAYSSSDVQYTEVHGKTSMYAGGRLILAKGELWLLLIFSVPKSLRYSFHGWITTQNAKGRTSSSHCSAEKNVCVCVWWWWGVMVLNGWQPIWYNVHCLLLFWSFPVLLICKNIFYIMAAMKTCISCKRKDSWLTVSEFCPLDPFLCSCLTSFRHSQPVDKHGRG